MKATLLVIQIYAKQFSNFTVHLNVDNTSTFSWINKQTAPHKNIFKIVKTFWDFCILINIWVKASYIEFMHNKCMII